MANSASAEFWSDYDGTGVVNAKKHDPRDWLIHCLPMMAGYTDFLRGVRDGDLEIAGIVSKRPTIWRQLTTCSLARNGLNEFFSKGHQLVLTGSEAGKASHIVDRSETGAVALLDDRPHKIGPKLIDALSEVDDEPNVDTVARRQVTLGVVSHPRSHEYYERIGEYAAGRSDIDLTASDRRISITGRMFDLAIVRVEPYSHEAGLEFARAATPLTEY